MAPSRRYGPRRAGYLGRAGRGSREGHPGVERHAAPVGAAVPVELPAQGQVGCGEKRGRGRPGLRGGRRQRAQVAAGRGRAVLLFPRRGSPGPAAPRGLPVPSAAPPAPAVLPRPQACSGCAYLEPQLILAPPKVARRPRYLMPHLALPLQAEMKRSYPGLQNPSGKTLSAAAPLLQTRAGNP